LGDHGQAINGHVLTFAAVVGKGFVMNRIQRVMRNVSLSVAVAAASMLAAIVPAVPAPLPFLPSAMLGNWCEFEEDEAVTVYIRADGLDHDGAACEGGGAELTQDTYLTQDIGCEVRYREEIAAEVFRQQLHCREAGPSWTWIAVLRLVDGRLMVSTEPEL
jgi:hypothetical protein